MQQVIRQYAPDDMGGNGTNKDFGTINTAATGSSLGSSTEAFPLVDEPIYGGTTPVVSDVSDGNDPGIAGDVVHTEPVSTQSYESPVSTQTKSSGKTALITGASSGIGRELANLFAKDGYNLILVSRSEDSLQQIAQEYEQQFGIQATVISRDLADPSSPDEIYAETQRHGLQVDVLINNAGLGEYGKFATESDLQKELDLIQINSVSLAHLTKLFLKDMVARNEGKVLLMGSVASVVPHPMMAVYGATKAFNYSLGEALRNELKDTSITVTVLMPPPTDTDFFNKAGASHTVAQQQAHSMSPAEVAQIGYEALMAGKDKAAPGLSAKLQVVSGFVLPDSVNTQTIRNLMKDSNEAKQESKKTLTIALAVGAALLGGWWLLSRNRGNGAVRAADKAMNKALATNKVRSAKRLAKNALSSNPLSSTPLSSPVDKTLDTAKELFSNAKERVDDVVDTVLT